MPSSLGTQERNRKAGVTGPCTKLSSGTPEVSSWLGTEAAALPTTGDSIKEKPGRSSGKQDVLVKLVPCIIPQRIPSSK